MLNFNAARPAENAGSRASAESLDSAIAQGISVSEARTAKTTPRGVCTSDFRSGQP